MSMRRELSIRAILCRLQHHEIQMNNRSSTIPDAILALNPLAPKYSQEVPWSRQDKLSNDVHTGSEKRLFLYQFCIVYRKGGECGECPKESRGQSSFEPARVGGKPKIEEVDNPSKNDPTILTVAVPIGIPI